MVGLQEQTAGAAQSLLAVISFSAHAHPCNKSYTTARLTPHIGCP